MLPRQSGYETPSQRLRKKPFAAVPGAGWRQKQRGKAEGALFNGLHNEIRMHRRPPERMRKQLMVISLPRTRQPNGEGQQRRKDGDWVHKAC